MGAGWWVSARARVRERERERDRTSRNGFDNWRFSSASTRISLAFSAFLETCQRDIEKDKASGTEQNSQKMVN